jgi:hypothetical protein
MLVTPNDPSDWIPVTNRTRTRALTNWLRMGVLVAVLSLAGLSLGAPPANASAVGGVTGVVTYGGVPFENATVYLFPTSGPPTSTMTDSGGGYSFDNLDLGAYTISIHEQVFNPGGHPGYISDTATLTIGAPNAVLNAALNPWATGTGSIAGIVSDSASGDAIKTAYYGFSGQSQAASSTGFVDGAGAYTIGDLPPGDFTYNFSAPGYVPSSLMDISVEVGANLVRNITLVAANATIEGYLKDGGGNPIPNEQVDISAPGVQSSFASTDSLGYFGQSGLGAGTYTVSAGGQGTSWQSNTQSVTVGASATAAANFVLTPRVTASISGRALDGSGNGLQGICTMAYNAGGEIVGNSSRTGTDSRGNYTISDLAAGDYVLLFWDCNYRRVPAYAFTYYGGASNFPAATPITVTAGVDGFGKDVILTFGGTISGHIDLAAPGGTVNLPSYGGMDATTYQLVGSIWVKFPDPSPLVGTGGAGDYFVPGLPDGTYRIGFIDHRTGPRAYTPQYWNNVPTLASATNIVISGGTVVTGINATMSIPRPGDAAAAVATSDLTPSEQGGISSVGKATQGASIEVQVDPSLAGEWVSVWGHSTPVLLGNWVQVSVAGKVAVPISSTMPTGAHQLVAQDADGHVLGWAPIQIAADPVSGGLARTGAPTSNLIAPFAGSLLVMLAGIVLLTRRHRA